MTIQEAENNLILKYLSGSITYGTNREDSDIDIRGIFVPSKEYWIGLHTVEQIVDQSKYNDIIYYNIKKFFNLALNANPNILEGLWLLPNHYLWNGVPKHLQQFGKLLIENRNIFLSKKCRYSYCGYSYAQIKRMKSLNKNIGQNKKRLESFEKFGWDTKNGMHCIRLLKQGLEILVDGELHVFRHDIKLLKEILNGEYTYEQVVEMFNKYEALIEEAYIKSSLPSKPDFYKAEQLLLEIVEGHELLT